MVNKFKFVLIVCFLVSLNAYAVKITTAQDFFKYEISKKRAYLPNSSEQGNMLIIKFNETIFFMIADVDELAVYESILETALSVKKNINLTYDTNDWAYIKHITDNHDYNVYNLKGDSTNQAYRIKTLTMY